MAQYSYDINAAMRAGLTPDQIAAYLDQQKAKGDSYQLTPTPQATPQQSQQPVPKSNWFADALPTIGSIVGGIGGALVPFGGETGLTEIGGSALGSGVGETAKELIEGKPLNAGNIAEQTASGAIGGAGGLGVGKLASGVLGKLGENEAINGLNLTRLQQNALKIKNGESIANTLTRHGMVGTDAEGLTNGINKVQNSFDSIAKNNSVPLNQDALLSRGTAAIEALKNSSVESDKALADEVDKNLGNVMDKIANGKVTTLADLNAERQAFDNATKDSQFGSSSWGANRIVGDVLRNTAYDTADASNVVGPNGESLKEMGQNLRKLYNVSNIADKRVGQGNSAGVLSVSNMLLGGIGALMGAHAGPAGALAGYAATTEARKALANPVIAKVVSNTLTNSGKALTTPIGMGAVSGLGASIAGGLLPVNPGTPNGTQNNSNYTNNNQNQNTLPPSPLQAGANSTINSQGSQALPATPGQTISSPNTNPLAGYTINGQPIDPGTANLIQKIADYQMDPTKISSLRNEDRQRLMSLVSQYDPTYDSSQFPAKQKIRNDFTSGTSAKTINSLNTAIGHLANLAQTGKALNNGSLPLLNEGKNAITTGTGQAQVGNFNTAADAVAGEMAQVFKNSGATDSEIQAWRKNLNANGSPAQIQSNINEMIQLMNSRLESLQNQYQQGLGKPADFSFLSPESQAILQTLQSNGNNLPATP